MREIRPLRSMWWVWKRDHGSRLMRRVAEMDGTRSAKSRALMIGLSAVIHADLSITHI